MDFMEYFIFLFFVGLFPKAEWKPLGKKKNLLFALHIKFSNQKQKKLCEFTLDFPCSIMVNMGRKKDILIHY